MQSALQSCIMTAAQDCERWKELYRKTKTYKQKPATTNKTTTMYCTVNLYLQSNVVLFNRSTSFLAMQSMSDACTHVEYHLHTVKFKFNIALLSFTWTKINRKVKNPKTNIYNNNDENKKSLRMREGVANKINFEEGVQSTSKCEQRMFSNTVWKGGLKKNWMRLSCKKKERSKGRDDKNKE